VTEISYYYVCKIDFRRMGSFALIPTEQLLGSTLKAKIQAEADSWRSYLLREIRRVAGI